MKMRYTDKDLQTDAFTKLLGLPKISLEQLFKMSKETDEVVLDVMAENSHFVHVLEGYPDLMSFKHSVPLKDASTKISMENSSFHVSQSDMHRRSSSILGEEVPDIHMPFNAWLKRPNSMSIMDFYSDSMNFVTKLKATLDGANKELEDVLKPHDNIMRTLMEAEILKAAIKQYRQMQNFLIGEEVETKGHQYIEDESIVGSSDKMMFYIKEQNVELKKCKKIALNPFIVSKLDVNSVKLYNYPVGITVKTNPYETRGGYNINTLPVGIALA